MVKVTVIPATKKLHSKAPTESKGKRRVAGYARVSTDSEEQLTSYTAQVDYYTKYIKTNPDWEFVGVYTDEGISATNTKHRDGFNSMIADALDGKIDLIITKSVSRFARNTVDSLTAVRKLKEKCVEVYFEKENIYTFDSKGELLITIMSSLAQEESRSISENVTWGQRKRFADGKVSIPYKSFLGYKKGENGLPEIVPEQAEIVRRIYRMFISGHTLHQIATLLEQDGILSPRGCKTWQTGTIESILTNEKYKGSAILQKKFTVDFLSKKMKVNEGEVPQYYVENSHPAIIPPEQWEIVQREMAARKGRGKHHNSLSPFSSKIMCGDCGKYYGSKVWHSNSKYRRVVWQCNDKFKKESKCTTPHLYEETIKTLFVRVVSKLTAEHEVLLETCRTIIAEFANTSAIDRQLQTLLDEMTDTEVLIKKLIDDNSGRKTADGYGERYDAYCKRYDDAKQQFEQMQYLKITRTFQADCIKCFMGEIERLGDLPIAFSDRLWMALIDKVIVNADETLVFVFKNGQKVTEEM